MWSTTKRAIRTSAFLSLLFMICIMLLAYYRVIRALFGYSRGARTGPLPAAGSRPSRTRTLGELMDRLVLIAPGRSLPTWLGTFIGTTVDFLPTILGLNPTTAGYIYPYTADFEPVVLRSKDGTPLTGLVAVHAGDDKRPGIVISHGLFGSKNQAAVIDTALRAYYEWGFQVLVLDLRDCGESQRLATSPLSWGWKEAEDILAAVQYLHSLPLTTSVALLGMSLGGSAALLATSRMPAGGALRGGVLAINPFSDSEMISERLSTRPPLASGFFLPWLAYNLMLRVKTRTLRRPGFKKFSDYTREHAAQYYELGTEELYRRAAPVDHVSEIECPTLIIHAEDDPVVPVESAHSYATAAKDNPLVRVIIKRTGGHCAYPYVQRTWYFGILREFLYHWAESGWQPDSLSTGFPLTRPYGESGN